MIQVSYFIIDDDREIAYFPETRRFFFVNDEMKALISAILEKEKTDVIHQFGISEAEYDSFLGKMRLPKAAEPEQPDRGQRALNRLILHLSNDCNLRCVYCYANGGHYRTERDLMSKEMLDRIIDVIYREYEHVDRIQFFGGEPLLNMELIDHGCRRMREIEQSRGTDIDFGIVVNGTLINDRFIELENRAVMANKANANLFISIHVNAVEKGTQANGYSIHCLGRHHRYRCLDLGADGLRGTLAGRPHRLAGVCRRAADLHPRVYGPDLCLPPQALPPACHCRVCPVSVCGGLSALLSALSSVAALPDCDSGGNHRLSELQSEEPSESPENQAFYES